MKYRIIGSVVPAVEILFDESGESVYKAFIEYRDGKKTFRSVWEDGNTVTTRLPGPSFFASLMAAATLVPLEIPHIMPSREASF